MQCANPPAVQGPLGTICAKLGSRSTWPIPTGAGLAHAGRRMAKTRLNAQVLSATESVSSAQGPPAGDRNGAGGLQALLRRAGWSKRVARNATGWTGAGIRRASLRPAHTSTAGPGDLPPWTEEYREALAAVKN